MRPDAMSGGWRRPARLSAVNGLQREIREAQPHMHAMQTPAEHELAFPRVAAPSALSIVWRPLCAAVVAALVLPLSAAGAELDGIGETLGSGDLATVRDASPERLREFLAGGGDVRAADDAGRTLLWWAALLNPDPEVTRLLLEAGADPGAESLAGWTAAEISGSNPNPAVARLLRMYREAPEPIDFPPDVPLWRLAYGDWAATASAEAVETLLDGSDEAAVLTRRQGDLLYWAAANPNPGVARLLLERGADPNAKTSDGWTPLHGSMANANPLVARLLREHGADPNAGLSLELGGLAPVHWAAGARETSVGEGILPTATSDPVRRDLAYGIRHASVRKAERWLPQMTRQRLEAAESTAFHAELLRSAAAANLDPNVTRLLLDLGAAANADSVDGWTALHEAAANPNPAVARLLLERGADPNAVSADGWTPLHRAAMLGNPETAQLLLDAGGRLDAVGAGGRTALHWAARYNPNPAVAQLLLERGAVPAARDSGGATPSLLAWLNRRTDMALSLQRLGPEDAVAPERLLDLQWLSETSWVGLEALVASASEAQLSARDACGSTALHSIVFHTAFDLARHGAGPRGVRDDALDALLARGISLDALDSRGNSLAHYAAAGAALGASGGESGGNLRVVAALRNRGVDFNAAGSEGLLPVHYALVGGDFSGFDPRDRGFASWLAEQTGTDPRIDPVDGTPFQGGIVPLARMDACIAGTIGAYEAGSVTAPAGTTIVAADDPGSGGVLSSIEIGKIARRRAGATEEEVLVARAQSHLTKESNSIGMEFVTLPGGTFTMGSESGEADADERPLTRVSISSFSIGTTEVTRGQWDAVMGTYPSGQDSCAPTSDCPVVNVSWHDVDQFIVALEKRFGEGLYRYRLPREAEWEYAARARTSGERYAGNLDEIAWHGGNSGGMPRPVGMKTANAFDLYDMLGNAWEWVGDWYGRYPGTSLTNPTGPATGTRRALRGGGWYGDAVYSRAASRGYDNPAGKFNNVGFRLVREDRDVVPVRVGPSGTVNLKRQNDGTYTLDGNPISSGGRWTATNGNEYEFTLSNGEWTATWVPFERTVDLGKSGETVTLRRTEDTKGWEIDGGDFKPGDTYTARNGNDYKLTLAMGQWTASYVPVTQTVELVPSSNTVTLSRDEDMKSWSIDGKPVESGDQYKHNGKSYKLKLRGDGTWTASEIHTSIGVAGTDTKGFSGDGGQADESNLNDPAGVAVDRWGDFYIADSGNHRIRKVSLSGVISTVAGTGTGGFSGDGGAADKSELNNPVGVAVDSLGDLYIADAGNHRIRKVSLSGVISTVAGTGTGGFSGDGGAADKSELNNPVGVAVDSLGNLYIADSGNHRIRKVDSGVISTVAGSGFPTFSGDGGAADKSELKIPVGVAVDSLGNLYIADSGNHRIRKVDSSSGIISTVAGTGISGLLATGGSSGDEGPAVGFDLSYPDAVAVDRGGTIYIVDSNSSKIRKVDADRKITTVVLRALGNDPGVPVAAIAVDTYGDLYWATALRVYRLTLPGE